MNAPINIHVQKQLWMASKQNGQGTDRVTFIVLALNTHLIRVACNVYNV